ncbi:MAG TPA: 4-hydroxy-2-oxovalerate aldolase [Anaerovoracaceae bacterium]|nr:4-hydroxy-2-oxovalerate aldolase [Anaerovoracaceae bacterium]
MSKKAVKIIDTTLRDGMHAVGHQFTPEQVAAIAKGLDEAGVSYIEVSHGDGLAGASYNYGWDTAGDEERLKAAQSVIKNGKLTVLLIPGIGTHKDLEMAVANGAKAVRIATHVTEADIAEQHIRLAKELGLETFGFLMMSHMVPPAKVAEQAKLFHQYGADHVYIADSAGYLLPEDVKERVQAAREAVPIPVGFHAHQNLTLATANSLAAIQAGASYVDACCRGLGAGAGNTQIEALVGILQRIEIDTGIDFYKIMDVAEKIVEPLMHRPQVVRTAPLMLGYAGVYSSFLLHTYKAAEKFGLEPRDILVELGKRKMVGGQEDMIIDVAYQLAQERETKQ